MNNIYRIIDVNINRVSEGLRVLEDLARFYCNHPKLTEDIKVLRHRTRKTVDPLETELLRQRDAQNDVGLQISQQTELDAKENLENLVTGNCKRVQEGLRVVEENLKIVGHYDLSKEYEQLRYDAYTVEKQFYFYVAREQRIRKLGTDLYGITSEEHSKGRSNLEVVEEMIAGGIEIIQYREKDKSALDKYQECMDIRKITREAGVTFIVNDDVHIALAVEADGVHIGQDDLPLPVVRQLVGDEMIIGISTHSPEQAREAVALGADYIGVGPIFATSTKKDVSAPVGLDYLQYVANNIDLPFVAIGGIKQHNLPQVVEGGAWCVAMITEIVESDDMKQTIGALRRTMEKAMKESGV